MSYFPEIHKWVIPKRALLVSQAEMRQDGIRGDEGTCLWLGTKADGVARVTQVALLRGTGITKHPLNVTVSPALMREVHDVALLSKTILVGQTHTHGAFVGVDLSPTDHLYGIKV